MRTKLLLLISIISFHALADVCICTYPKEDAKYGGGYKGEILFYKMGCALWLLTETRCRKEKIMDINLPLETYLDNKIKAKDKKIRIGYVGHWGSSDEYIDYVDEYIAPLLNRYEQSIEVDNTACLAMEEANQVQEHIEKYDYKENQSLKLEGNQTTSIGMWDKLSIRFRKADLTATASSDNSKLLYPKCKKFVGKRCTGFQLYEKGLCSEEDSTLTELICNHKIKNQKVKRKKIWNRVR